MWIFYEWSFRDDVHQKEYAQNWKQVFDQCRNLEDIDKLPDNFRPDLIVKRRFAHGSWVVGVTQDISEASVRHRTAVLYDSNRNMYVLGVSLSGFEVLNDEIQNTKAATLTDFYAQASKKFGLVPFE